MLLYNVLDYKNRIIGLDVLRSIAILLVIWGHGSIIIPVEFREVYLIPRFIDGVSIFFVLSGFLIGNIIFKYLINGSLKPATLVNFWNRRWIRTLPNYFLVLFFLMIFSFKDWGLNVSYFFFLQNFLTPMGEFFRVSWSLAIEEWFYLLFPLCIFLVGICFPKSISPKKQGLVAIIFFLLVPMFFRYIKLQSGIEDLGNEVRMVVIYRLDSIAWGILGAYFFSFHKTFWNNYSRFFIVVAICLFLLLLIDYALRFTQYSSYSFWLTPTGNILGFTVEALAVLLTLPYLSKLTAFKWSAFNRFFVFVSKISYSLYLTHSSIILWLLLPAMLPFLQQFQLRPELIFLIQNIIYWGLSFLLSFLIYIYFEQPILSIRDKFTKPE